MSRHFRTRCPLRRRVYWLTEASSVRPDSPRTSTGDETVKLYRRQTIVTEWPSWTWCRTWNWRHSYLKSALFHSFVRALLWCKDIMSFREFRALGCSPSGAAPTLRRLSSWQLGNFSIRRIASPGNRTDEVEGHIREYYCPQADVTRMRTLNLLTTSSHCGDSSHFSNIDM